MSRKRRAPNRYGEWEDSLKGASSREKVKEKMWAIEDVLEKRGHGDDEEVLVKWEQWDGPNTWVNLSYNPELRQYLEKNKANPNACSMFNTRLCASVPVNHSIDSDVMALRQAIFDSLAEYRHTPDGALGRQSRVSVKLPFRKADFDKHFRTIDHEGIPLFENGNVSCYINGSDLTKAIGDGWSSRCYENSSTETYVNLKEYIHLAWGYKVRKNYSHNNCQRCHWKGEEIMRPQMCTTEEETVTGPPWIQLTYTRGRRNMVTGQLSRKRAVN